MDAGGAVILALLAAACGGEARCPEGQVWDGGDCAPYQAGEPLAAPEVWRPAPGTSWQWQLSGEVRANEAPQVQMFDLDLFDVPEATIAALRGAGIVVVCYVSAGSHEDWRPDADLFPPEAIGKALDGWEGERWLDIMDPTVRRLMEARLDLAIEKGCDGVEPDNVDGYANDDGLGLNATEQLSYNRFLADAAHARGLSVGLKNDLDQLEALEPRFDWALNEECLAFDECDRLRVFTDRGKAAFHVEYVDEESEATAKLEEVCGRAPWLDSLVKTWDLGEEWWPCEG